MVSASNTNAEPGVASTAASSTANASAAAIAPSSAVSSVLTSTATAKATTANSVAPSTAAKTVNKAKQATAQPTAKLAAPKALDASALPSQVVSSVAVKSVPTKPAAKASVHVPFKTLLAKANLSDSALTHVTKDNFLQYFELNGSATYDASTGIVTITPDQNNQVGNFALKSKIDMSTSFTLTGSVNLGSRTQSQGGADGIAFGFHTGNTTDIGNAGGNLGLGGLLDAIGFKLDTYHNNYRAPQSDKTGAQINSNDSNGFGWDTDPDAGTYPQFGAFVTTADQQVKSQDETSVQRWWATTDVASAQALNAADLDGNFHNFVVNYDGTARELTINYTETDGTVLTWTKQVNNSYQAMALIVSASTGGKKTCNNSRLIVLTSNKPQRLT